MSRGQLYRIGQQVAAEALTKASFCLLRTMFVIFNCQSPPRDSLFWVDYIMAWIERLGCLNRNRLAQFAALVQIAADKVHVCQRLTPSTLNPLALGQPAPSPALPL